MDIQTFFLYICTRVLLQGTKLCIPDWEHNVVPSTSTYLIKTLLTPPSVSVEVKKLANSSYYIVLGTKTNDLKCSTQILHHPDRYTSLDNNNLLFTFWQRTHDILTLFLSSSVNPNALVINHSYCQVYCLPICTFFLII